MRTKPADRAFGSLGDMTAMAKMLARMRVGKMHLDHRQFNRLDRIIQRNRCVGVSARIQQNRCCTNAARFMQPVNQVALVVRLTHIDAVAKRGCPVFQHGGDIIQRIMAIDIRLTQPQQIEVWPVEHENDWQNAHQIIPVDCAQSHKAAWRSDVKHWQLSYCNHGIKAVLCDATIKVWIGMGINRSVVSGCVATLLVLPATTHAQPVREPSVEASLPLDQCPITRMVYGQKDNPGVTMGFATQGPPEIHTGYASDLVLWVENDVPMFWFGFASPNGYGGTYLYPRVAPFTIRNAEDGDVYMTGDGPLPQDLLDVRFDAFDADLRAFAGPPQSTHAAPKLLFARDLGQKFHYEYRQQMLFADNPPVRMTIDFWHPLRCMSEEEAAQRDDLPRR